MLKPDPLFYDVDCTVQKVYKGISDGTSLCLFACSVHLLGRSSVCRRRDIRRRIMTSSAAILRRKCHVVEPSRRLSRSIRRVAMWGPVHRTRVYVRSLYVRWRRAFVHVQKRTKTLCSQEGIERIYRRGFIEKKPQYVQTQNLATLTSRWMIYLTKILIWHFRAIAANMSKIYYGRILFTFRCYTTKFDVFFLSYDVRIWRRPMPEQVPQKSRSRYGGRAL